MNIGPYSLRNNVFVAPMAGVTDRPFRQLCKQLGAGYAVSEMAASDPRLWQSEKTSRRINHDGEMEPKAVQIAGADPVMLADCAKYNVERGAQIIDINMGCPVKKVCNSWCGSALLQDEDLVARILDAVVSAVDVPVTLKFRTGWDRANKNALKIAARAEAAGIAMLTLHGRTRADGYSGEAEYDTIAAVKAAVTIPVVANGDITTPEKAREVLRITGADAVMVGRAAQGRPWIFREIDHFLRTGEHLPAPLVTEVAHLMEEHLQAHYAFYGDYLGVRTARKHIGWYVRDLPGGETFRRSMNRIEDCGQQLQAVRQFFADQTVHGDRLQYGLADEVPLAA
ncbi:tRNA-dihydrouridine synthase or NifR3-like protein [Herbaspirillum sp. GW103]|uniref:tRNA dihydrouridine synthase DusB n=1 Tax=unclassified Herbaspirillum TaxID=2624150 RepID=UPI00025E4CB7|nr:tRNA dihydrouridine synthase DusB [Herbaspirillum sp. GW103]EIJ45129.1 tRNA-dihydrouridine synthase or NifR3-like protein [Herbaspirillum sp. GW103]MCI1004535.1 tRNA dihydrouridine synthase DusB [Herbaspirillum sp. C7C8]